MKQKPRKKEKMNRGSIFKCSCGCGSQLAVGSFGDGQFVFSIKETVDDGQTAHWNEIITSPEQAKEIIKLLFPKEKEEVG